MSVKCNESNMNKNFTIENNIIKSVKKVSNVQKKSIGELLFKALSENVNHIGQIDAETEKYTTFAEMRDKSIRCALWMRKEGFKRGDVIGLCTHNHLDTYIPFFATFFVGATQNPWYHDISLKEAQYFFQLTKPKLMFACESAIDILIKAAKLENLDVKFIVFGKHSEVDSLNDIMELQTKDEVLNFQLPKLYPNDVCLLIFSSGTTGNPKAIQHSYESLYDYLTFCLFSPLLNMVYLWYSSLGWISGVLMQFNCIITISSRILHENFNSNETCKYIEKYKINLVLFSPAVLSNLYNLGALTKYDLSTLKIIITGGTKMTYKILEGFQKVTNIPITQAYGMTEICGGCLQQTPECKSIDSVGFIRSNCEIKIIDLENNQVLGPNQPGELCIKAPWKMVGYLNNEAETKEMIDEEGWVHSEDLGYYDENGEFFILDRIKEIIKVAGCKISPYELEEILMNHPAVMEVVVVPVKHKLYGETPVALIKKNPKFEVTEDELIKLSSELGKFKTLSHVKFMDELPLTPSFKKNRTVAKEIAKIFDE